MAESKMKKVKKFTGVYYYESEKSNKNKDIIFYINYKDERGKQKFEKIGKKSEGYSATYAHNKRNERVQQIRHGETVSKKKLSLNDLFDQYYLPHSKKTKKSHWKDLERYNHRIRDSIGSFDINKINVKVVQDWKTKMQEDNLSTGTVNIYLKTLRAIINYTRGIELHDIKSPFKSGKMDQGVSIDPENNERERYLTENEIQKLLDALCLEDRLTYELSLVAVFTGMRSDEVRSLTWKGVDLENKQITLEKSETKGKSRRSIPMHPKVYKLFSMKNQGESHEIIWQKNDGSYVNRVPKAFERISDELFNGNGGERIVFHSLRHSFASHMAMKGTPLPVLQKLLGHATIDMTMKYSHLIPDYSAQFIEGLNF